MTKDEFDIKWKDKPKHESYVLIRADVLPITGTHCVVSCLEEARDFVRTFCTDVPPEIWHYYLWLGNNPSFRERCTCGCSKFNKPPIEELRYETE
jgi:hypothetical protein